MSKNDVKEFPGQVEEGQEAATAAVREAIQCSDTTNNMNYGHSMYASCEKEKNYNQEKTRLVV